LTSSLAIESCSHISSFSQGLRGCPGGAIAVAVIKLFVAKVIWEFDLESVKGQKGISFDKDLEFFTFLERPQYFVRFIPVSRPNS
jgi:hypothetical protein